MPNVDTACMNVFLEELAEEIKEDFILIMDGAGWHKSKNLIVPKNIQIFLLPPYCPELNPVERLWKFIKDNTIKNNESVANPTQKFIEISLIFLNYFLANDAC